MNLNEKKSVVLIGKNSFLVQNFVNKLEKDYNVFQFSYYDYHHYTKIINDASYVINFSIAPESSNKFLGDANLDLEIARCINNTTTKYVMLSSRKVYGKHESLKIHNEEDSLVPFDLYSENKVATEEGLWKILSPEQVCITRLSNFIIPTYSSELKNNYIGWISKYYLENDCLDVTYRLDDVKDFITRDYFQDSLLNLLNNNFHGVFNISSNINLTQKELLETILGADKVFQKEGNLIADQFLLSNNKLLSITGKPITKMD